MSSIYDLLGWKEETLSASYHQEEGEGITLNELVDLAFRSLELGAVNVYILRLVLQELVKIAGNGKEIKVKLNEEQMSHIQSFKNYITGAGARTQSGVGGSRIRQQKQPTNLTPGQKPWTGRNQQTQAYQFKSAQPQAVPPISSGQPDQPLNDDSKQRPIQSQQGGYPRKGRMKVSDQPQRGSLKSALPQLQLRQPVPFESAALKAKPKPKRFGSGPPTYRTVEFSQCRHYTAEERKPFEGFCYTPRPKSRKVKKPKKHKQPVQPHPPEPQPQPTIQSLPPSSERHESVSPPTMPSIESIPEEPERQTSLSPEGEPSIQSLPPPEQQESVQSLPPPEQQESVQSIPPPPPERQESVQSLSPATSQPSISLIVSTKATVVIDSATSTKEISQITSLTNIQIGSATSPKEIGPVTSFTNIAIGSITSSRAVVGPVTSFTNIAIGSITSSRAVVGPVTSFTNIAMGSITSSREVGPVTFPKAISPVVSTKKAELSIQSVLPPEPERQHSIPPQDEYVEQRQPTFDSNCCHPDSCNNKYRQTGVRPCNPNPEDKVAWLERQFKASSALPNARGYQEPAPPQMFKNSYYCDPTSAVDPSSCREPPVNPRRSYPPRDGTAGCYECGRCNRMSLKGTEVDAYLAAGCSNKPAKGCSITNCPRRRKCDSRKCHAPCANPTLPPVCDMNSDYYGHSQNPQFCRKTSRSALLDTQIHLPNCQTFKSNRRPSC